MTLEQQIQVVINKGVANAFKGEIERLNRNLQEVTNSLKKANEDIELYTVSEVAEILKTSKATVYNYIEEGYLTGLVIGHTKIMKSELVDFINKIKRNEITLKI